ncbi:MAG: hypothetical protein ABSD32_11405 [Mycobacterium sp.]
MAGELIAPPGIMPQWWALAGMWVDHPQAAGKPVDQTSQIGLDAIVGS